MSTSPIASEQTEKAIEVTRQSGWGWEGGGSKIENHNINGKQEESERREARVGVGSGR